MKKFHLSFLILTFFGIIAVVAIICVSYGEIKREREIGREVGLLQAEADNIKNNNETLKDKISYFEPQEFKESVAKEKLNLQQPGEKVVIIKENPYNEITVPEDVGAEKGNNANQAPNYIKWWNKFFRS